MEKNYSWNKDMYVKNKTFLQIVVENCSFDVWKKIENGSISS